jgi:hypothetical protein
MENSPVGKFVGHLIFKNGGMWISPPLNSLQEVITEIGNFAEANDYPEVLTMTISQIVSFKVGSP